MSLQTLAQTLGPLRTLLALSTLAVAALGPFLDGTADIHTWRIVPTVVGPTFMMMLVFVLPLDITMSLVFRADSPPVERARLGRVVLIEAVLFMLLLAAWTPFFLRFFALSTGGDPG